MKNKKNLFGTTKEERGKAIVSFKNLLNHPGWQMIEHVLGLEVERLTALVITNPQNKSKEQVDVWRKTIQALKKTLNIPENAIERLSENEIPEQSEFDPYFTEDELDATTMT